MRLTKPQFFLHLTHEDWGPKTKLWPKDIGYNRPVSEPKVPRICVAPTLSKCLVAIGVPHDNAEGHIYIYRTYHKCRAAYPFKVCDVSVTSERWIKKPTTFVLVGMVHYDWIENILWYPCGSPTKGELRKQTEARERFKNRLEYYFNERYLKYAKIIL